MARLRKQLEQYRLVFNGTGHHCIAIDHRGHGCSGHIPLYEDYHFPDYISDLQALLSILSLEQFVLIGHSMGGTIASLYGAFLPPQTDKNHPNRWSRPKHEEPEMLVID